MKLPGLPTFLTKQADVTKQDNRFIALELTEGNATASIWEGSSQVQPKTVFFDTNAASVLKQILDTDSTISKIIFGLPSDHVEGSSIKTEHLPELKSIAQTNHLRPIGFVVIPEAIAHHLEQETNSPQTALFVDVTTTRFTISLFRIGKFIRSVDVVRTGNLYKDFETGLLSFNDEEILPSKIILYDGKNPLDDLKEQLLSYPWQNNEQFMHVPRIECLPPHYAINSIIYAGMSNFQEEATTQFTPDEQSETPVETVQPITQTSDITNNSTIQIVEEEDTSPQDTSNPINSKPISPVVTDASDNFGFSIQQPNTSDKVQQSVIEKPHIVDRKRVPLSMSSFHLPSVTLPQLAITRSLMTLPHRSIMAVGIIAVLFLGFGVFSVYSFPKATVYLIAEPKVLNNNVTMTLNTSRSDIDVEKKEVPGKLYSVTVNGETSDRSSGKKTIGEKAVGEVLVYNKSRESQTIRKGAVLGATSSVTFTLDSDVLVASASDTGESLTYGKQSAKVTATKIGPSGNIKKDTEFSVQDISKSVLSAKNDADFSGGTEREIDIVSDTDQKRVLENLTKQLVQQAKDELSSKLNSGEVFLNESVQTNIVEKKFDKKVGEESDNVSLSLSLEVSQTSYKEEDLNKFLTSYMEKQVTGDYLFDSSKSYFTVTKTEQDDEGSTIFDAIYHAYLLPNIDLSSLPKEFSGKTRDNLEKIVANLKDKKILGYDISYTRKLPFFGNRLPFNKNNIEVKVIPY